MPTRTLLLSLGVLLLCPACEDTPAEPAPVRSTAKARGVDDKKRPLEWSVPPTWTTARTALKGEYRGKYQIPTSGDAKHQPEMLVTYLGKGKDADPIARVARFRDAFEGPNVATAQVETIHVGELTVRVLELAATYKFPIGPPMGKKKKSAAMVLKKNWRGLGAAVTTPKRGNWFFQLVGPDDAVAAARDDFRTMLKGLR